MPMSAPAWWSLYDAAGVDNLDARSVPCPTCGAATGTYCKRPSGHKAWDAHAERWDDAVRAAAPEREEAQPVQDDDLDGDDLDYEDPYPNNPPPPRPPPPVDGQLYQYHAYAHCDGCRTKWRRLVECRYRVDHTRRDFLGGPMIHGEHVRDLSGWEKAPGAGSSFALWITPEDGARGGCPTCSQTTAQTALDLDAPAPATHGTTAADYTPDQAGHYDNPAAPYAGPVTEEEALDALVPAGFVEGLDPRHGTGQVVEALKAAGVTKPRGAPWNWNRLANLCTFAALDLKHAAAPDPEPQPGEQLTLA